jgi:hypothetical protein
MDKKFVKSPTPNPCLYVTLKKMHFEMSQKQYTCIKNVIGGFDLTVFLVNKS